MCKRTAVFSMHWVVVKVINPKSCSSYLSISVIKAQQEERQKNYMDFLATEEQHLIPNSTENECPICFSIIPPGEGAVLRDCFHTFCRSDKLKASVALLCAVQQVYDTLKRLCFIFHCDTMCIH